MALEVEDLAEKARKLQIENKKLRRELWRQKRKPTRIAGYGLLLLGCATLVLSVFYTSNVTYFVGLALIFWGGLLHFISPTRYVKSSLLNSTAISSCSAIDGIISALRLEGDGIYLPPESLEDLKGGRLFMARKNHDFPIPVTSKEDKAALNQSGMIMTPLGIDLVNLYEEELGADFVKVKLDYLQDNLPRLFIEGLEMAKGFRISVKDDTVEVQIENSIFADLCKEARKLPIVCKRIGCPLCSSIASALARTTGRPIVIAENNCSENGDLIEVQYRILEG